MQEQYIHIDKNSNKFYYKDREMTIFHRFNGPAVEHADGYKEWWVNGKRLSEGAFDTVYMDTKNGGSMVNVCQKEPLTLLPSQLS
jgi:hypothetical protein